jgi:hypothetical protein
VGVETGLHMLLEAEESYDEETVAQLALQKGIRVYPLGPYCLESKRKQEIYVEAIRYFKLVYKAIEGQYSKRDWLIGRDAITALQGYMLGGDMNPGLTGHLTHFAFQVGARRALNFSEFFQSENDVLAEIKLLQSEVYGRCHSLAVHGDWHPVGEALSELAELEDKFRDALFM